jgi:hypothetical protein
VTRYAAPAAPHDVPPSGFDAARTAAGHPRLPAAKQIVRRLRLGWYELLELVHAPSGGNLNQRLGVARRAAPREVTLDEVIVALRLIAARTGLKGLWPARYAVEREAVVAEQGRSHGHATPSMAALPTVAQIEVQFGWAKACRAAGLDEPDRQADRIRGLSQVEVTDRFIDDIGCLPWGISAIARYARARDIPTVKLRAVDRYVQEVAALRAAVGKWTPPQPPPRGARPGDTVVDRPQDQTGAHLARPGPAASRSRRKRSWDNLDAVVAGLAEAYRRDGADPLTQKLHRRLASEAHGEIPNPSVVDRAARAHGTTAAAIRRRAGALARE